MQKLNKNNESGRSMVEMLGVLAIVGVLSVAGIAGYTTAMNAHRANEAINRVMRLAVVVSGQKLLGQTALIPGTDADNVTVEEDTANGKFTLTISGLSEPVRTKISNMDVATADLGTSGDDLTFTFKNDLSSQSASGGTTTIPETPSEPTNCTEESCMASESCTSGTYKCVVQGEWAELVFYCNAGVWEYACECQSGCLDYLPHNTQVESCPRICLS